MGIASLYQRIKDFIYSKKNIREKDRCDNLIVLPAVRCVYLCRYTNRYVIGSNCNCIAKTIKGIGVNDNRFTNSLDDEFKDIEDIIRKVK